METLVEQGIDYLTRERRRLQNLLQGKVSIPSFQYKLNDDIRHANAEGKLLSLVVLQETIQNLYSSKRSIWLAMIYRWIRFRDMKK